MDQLVQIAIGAALAPTPQQTAPIAPRQLDFALDDARVRRMTIAERQAALRSLAHLLLEAGGMATREAGDDNA